MHRCDTCGRQIDGAVGDPCAAPDCAGKAVEEAASKRESGAKGASPKKGPKKAKPPVKPKLPAGKAGDKEGAPKAPEAKKASSDKSPGKPKSAGKPGPPPVPPKSGKGAAPKERDAATAKPGPAAKAPGKPSAGAPKPKMDLSDLKARLKKKGIAGPKPKAEKPSPPARTAKDLGLPKLDLALGDRTVEVAFDRQAVLEQLKLAKEAAESGEEAVDASQVEGDDVDATPDDSPGAASDDGGDEEREAAGNDEAPADEGEDTGAGDELAPADPTVLTARPSKEDLADAVKQAIAARKAAESAEGADEEADETDIGAEPVVDPELFEPTVMTARPSKEELADAVKQAIAERDGVTPDAATEHGLDANRLAAGAAKLRAVSLFEESSEASDEDLPELGVEPLSEGEDLPEIGIEPLSEPTEAGLDEDEDTEGAVDPADPDRSEAELLLMRDPNFGRRPYQVIEYPDGFEPNPGAPPTHADEIHWQDAFDMDALRRLVVFVLGVVATISASYLAVTNWWTPAFMVATCMLLISPGLAVLGVLIPSEQAQSRRIYVGLVSAGYVVPLVFLASVLWSIPNIRELAFEYLSDPSNVPMVRAALDDSSVKVSGQACRILSHEVSDHGLVLGRLDSRPEMAAVCFEKVESTNQELLLNRVGSLWRDRLTVNTDHPEGCRFSEAYGELPLESEAGKFSDFMMCAFSADNPELQRCCGATLSKTFGEGTDLIPGLQVSTLERPTDQTVRTLLGPVVFPEALKSEARRNIGVLKLDEPEVRHTAVQLTCLLMEEPGPRESSMRYLSALAAAECKGMDIPEARLDDWRDICDIATGRMDGLSFEDHYCVAVDRFNVAKAARAASVLVTASIMRHGSHQLEKGIEVGTVRKALEEKEKRIKQSYEDLVEAINSQWDATAKNQSLSALEKRRQMMESDKDAVADISRRWSSSRARLAEERRRNIMRIMTKTDPKWRKMKEKKGR